MHNYNEGSYQASNIHASCGKADKLIKTYMRYEAEIFSHPSVFKNSLLPLDSWTDQADSDIYDGILIKSTACERMHIPVRKTIGEIQPLNRFFFSQWHYFK